MGEGAQVAWSDDVTRQAVREYARRAALALACGSATIAAFAIAAGLLSSRHYPALVEKVGSTCLFVGVLVALAGVTGTWKCWRARRLLRRHAWVPTCATYRIAMKGRGNGQPALMLHGRDDAGDDEVLSIAAMAYRYRRLTEVRREDVLAVRARHGWSVIAPLDRSVVVIAKRPRWPFQTAFLRRVVKGST
jgi:hypothetical protein